ncbi:hypothetical protein [Hyalangium rubrum]|uniref:SAM-dependent methyltransferase n=1 Tax=Hyalangium rubrum TaxID=3103134 RepID=A0ABU5H969_9BACT|nr:hypothetical protein [Hyalangium sp. s54d21]MDY7228640.1 hypothetical protein [Hyalangium sp. s54d21]
MAINFRKALDRHWTDADSLDRAKRLANADHLFGISAECALKAVMIALGAPTNSDGDLSNADHQKHINTLWSNFRIFAQGPHGARYAAKLGSINPFKDWHVIQRYFGDEHFTAATVQAHRAGAFKAKEVFQLAIQDGILK